MSVALDNRRNFAAAPFGKRNRDVGEVEQFKGEAHEDGVNLASRKHRARAPLSARATDGTPTSSPSDLQHARREIFNRLLTHVTPLGLFSEDIARADRQLLGNFPQAYTHVGLIHAAITIGELLEAREARFRAWTCSCGPFAAGAPPLRASSAWSA